MTDYKTDFLCTYQLLEDLDDSNTLYQQQFLQAFGLDNNKSIMLSIDSIFEKIDKLTEELYNKYKDDNFIKKLMEIVGKNDTEYIKFQKCFSYDTFYLMHNLLCKIINETTLDEKQILILFNKLNIN